MIGFKSFQNSRVVQPGSAVPAHAMSEEQTFRSEANGSLPYEGYWFQLFQKFKWFQMF